MIDIAIPSDCKIRKKEQEKLEKYQETELCIVKVSVVPELFGALGAVTPKLEE